MLQFLADENFNAFIVRGFKRRVPEARIEFVQLVGQSGQEDPIVLRWAAEAGAILLTHDSNTLPDHAYARVRNGQSMPGVFVIPQRFPIGSAIEELTFLTACSVPDEWDGQVIFLPL